MRALRSALLGVIGQSRPMTVRQVFYQAVSRGLVAKTETEYKSTIVRLLTDMRRSGELPCGWIVDNTRWMRKPQTHTGLGAALADMQEFYRRSLWQDQGAYVEVWLEKDALAGVLYEITARYDVPLMVTRGYPSLAFLAIAAEAIAIQKRPCFLYYFGDHDPSGVDIPRHTEAQLRELVAGWADDPAEVRISFEVVAVTAAQIVEGNLPTRPTKKTDTRSKNFEGESVEVDAIPPGQLRDLVEEGILQHLDAAVLKRTKAIERQERESLASLVEAFRGGRS